MQLETRLNTWIAAGLIDQEAAQKILAFEDEKPRASWVLYGVSAIGACVILIGVISLLAANWAEIPDLVKLCAYFSVLILLAAACVRLCQSPGLLRESLLVLFAGFVLAGIGLLGQIFNLQSDGYSAFFLWLALTFPLTLIGRWRLLANMWFVGLLYAVLSWNWAAERGHYGEFPRLYSSIAIAYTVLAFGYLGEFYLSKVFCQTARTWGYAVIFLLLGIISNLTWSTHSTLLHVKSSATFAWVAVLIACFASQMFAKNSTPFVRATLLFTLISSSLLTILPWSGAFPDHDILGCILFLLSWAGLATLAALYHRKRLFDFAAFVITTRFVVVYFEVFGSLAATGWGLILSGIIILSAVFCWSRYRSSLASVIENSPGASK